MKLVSRLSETNAKLHRVVEGALVRTTGSKYLLMREFKSTLKTLRVNEWIKQRDFKLLRNPQLVEQLITKMHMSIELVRKFTKPSKFHLFKFCFSNQDDDYTEQLVDLDRYFGNMVEFLWRNEEARKTDELYRELQRVYDEAAKRKLAPESAHTSENSNASASSNVESSRRKQEENLVVRFRTLLCLVINKERHNSCNAGLKSKLLGDLRSTLEKLRPFVEGIDLLNLPTKELNDFQRLMDERIKIQVEIPTRKSKDEANNDMVELVRLNHSIRGELSKLREMIERWLRQAVHETQQNI